MGVEVVRGNLLAQPVEVIVNAWNRNLLPWWLLWPKGVAAAIRQQAGAEPFRQLAALGRLQAGQAVLTGAGRLPYRGIIHVASIQPWARSSPGAVQTSVHNAMALAQQHGFTSIAFPILGSGSGGLGREVALETMVGALASHNQPSTIVIVDYGA